MANKIRGPSELALPTYFPIKARIKSGVTSNQIDYYMGEFGSTAERSIYLDKLNYVQMTDVPHVHLPPNTLAATRFERLLIGKNVKMLVTRGCIFSMTLLVSWHERWLQQPQKKDGQFLKFTALLACNVVFFS